MHYNQLNEVFYVDYVRFEEMCKKKGTSPTAVTLNLGLSKGNATSWKNRGNPSVDILIKIAKELECSTDYLLGLEACAPKEAPAARAGLDEYQQDLLNTYNALEIYNKDKVRAFAHELHEGQHTALKSS